ncbi:MAG: CoA-binding protein, partial [Acidimicrobiales bacterium]
MSGSGSLDAFFSPGTVAVVGASRRPGKVGHDVLVDSAGRGFAGHMVGVNPATDGAPIAGWPVVASLAHVDRPVDLALVALPAETAPAAVADCAAAGVRAAVVAAAGLGELGGEAAALEAGMGAVARAAGMRILGPNGIGLYVGRIGLNLMYWWDIPPGRVALVTQSGNVAIALCRLLDHAGAGLSSCAGVGNQLDVTAAELVG